MDTEQGPPTLNGSRLLRPAWSRRILDVLVEAASRRDRLPWWSGIGIGALAAGVGALARLALLGNSTTRLAYVTFYPVVVVASLVGGLSAGTRGRPLRVHYPLLLRSARGRHRCGGACGIFAKLRPYYRRDRDAAPRLGARRRGRGGGSRQ